jgi:hypothetical protein
MIILRLIAIAAFLIFLVSCTTSGRRCDIAALRQNIKFGESTRSDVLKVCGEPITSELDVKGDYEVLHYAFIYKRVTPLGALTNRLGAGTEITSDKEVVDVFLKEGKVVDVKSETASNTSFHH